MAPCLHFLLATGRMPFVVGLLFLFPWPCAAGDVDFLSVPLMPLPGGKIKCIGVWAEKPGEKRLVVGTDTELAVYTLKGQRVRPLLDRSYVRCLFGDEDTLWVGTDRGAFMFKGEAVNQVEIGDKEDVTFVGRSQEGLWFNASSRGLFLQRAVERPDRVSKPYRCVSASGNGVFSTVANRLDTFDSGKCQFVQVEKEELKAQEVGQVITCLQYDGEAVWYSVGIAAVSSPSRFTRLPFPCTFRDFLSIMRRG
jgi:hypothetical protein